MAFCTSCGAQAPDTAVFCNSCGARMGAASPVRRQDAPQVIAGKAVEVP